MPFAQALLDRWTQRRDEWRKLGVLVAGATVAAEVLDDLHTLVVEATSELLTLTAAAQESGYSVRQLRRLVRHGTIPNVGRPHAPKLRRCDLPRKPVALRIAPPEDNFETARGRIAKSVINPHSRAHHDDTSETI
jgi:hypothetical protein